MRHTHTSPGQKINLKNLLEKCLEKEVFVKNWTLTIKINNKESKSVTVNFVKVQGIQINLDMKRVKMMHLPKFTMKKLL